MQKQIFLWKKGWIIISMILSTMVFGILGACDGGDASVQDTRPLIPDPSWDCGMPNGIPSPESGELVFEAEMTVGNIHDIGQTPYGHRHLIEIKGGTISMADIEGEVLEGGLDYQLTLSNGAMEIDQVNLLQTSDGSNIYFRACGASADATDVRIVPFFEAPTKSPYNFLNTGKFAGTRELDVDRKIMKIKIYDVANVAVDPAAAGAIQVTQPEDVQDQSWECREAGESETRGTKLLTEKVDLGPWFTVGKSKYGWRNSIPITGGTVSGTISGKVLFGGADHQVWSNSGINLDARYTLETDDGELILVRNCGPMTKLTPILETRVDGKYGYLNDADWLSTFPTPNASIDAVTIRIFESTSK